MLAAAWDIQRIIIFCLPFLLLLFAAAACLLMRKTIRTRLRVGKQLRDDPDINEWLVVFSWSRKVLYVPAILASLIAAVFMVLQETGVWGSMNTNIVGGTWLAIFFLNFLIDEYEISVKVLLIAILCVIVLALWLTFMHWLVPFLKLFRRVQVSISSSGYVAIAAIFLLAIFISWLRGLFYYVAITPNYLNVQVGPTETGEQVSREEYSTRIDTGDFLERLQGFGRIIITFSDQRRQPMMLLTRRIGRKAARLESIRGKLAIDRLQTAREGQNAQP